jgi:hypothetical protein
MKEDGEDLRHEVKCHPTRPNWEYLHVTGQRLFQVRTLEASACSPLPIFLPVVFLIALRISVG